MEIEIKQIGLRDCDLVIDLFDKYRVFYKQESDPALAERFIEERLENNESVIFAAFINNNGKSTPAGFTQLYPKISSVRATKNWVLNDLYVDEPYRKQGIGERLIQAALNFAKEESAKYVQLETAVDNSQAQHLYETIGFVRQGNDTEFYVYRKDLP